MVKIEEDWWDLDREKLRKYMRYDYKSSALYKCGKNISQLTTKEKYQLIAKIFDNFYNSGYSKYGHLFSDLFNDTFKIEIEEIGKDRFDKYLLRYFLKT